MKNLFLYLGIISMFSCQNDLATAVNDKIEVVDLIISSSEDSYQFHRIRNTSFEVSRIPYDNDNAIISIYPKPIIEENFSNGKPIDLFVVQEFAKLNCSYLYFNDEFIRIDFIEQQIGVIKSFSKKNKIILFKGKPPQNQNFILKDTDIKELTNGWEYIVISNE